MNGSAGFSPAPERKYSRVKFGPYELDLGTRELRKGSTRIRLPEQASLVLCALVARPGELVTRDELQTRLWSGDTFVDFDHGLNVMVSRLREAINDSAKHPRYIETVPRRGYRFLASVEPAAIEETQPEPESLPPTLPAAKISPARVEDQPVAPATGKLKFSRMALVAAGVFATVATLFLGWRQFGTRAIPEQSIFPATTLAGSKDYASISSDGRTVAFVWGGAGTGIPGNRNVYVKLVDSGEPLRLSRSERQEGNPAFSPDDREVAFIRRDGEGYYVYIVPVLGGPERRICEAGPGLSWSPDKQWLAIASPPDKANRNHIVLHNLTTGEQRSLTNPGTASDSFPSFSPDGRKVAFVRSFSLSSREVMVVPITGGTPQQLTFDRRAIWGLDWTADGRQIVFAANRGGGESLWRIDAAGGRPVRITVTAHNAYYPSISRKGGRLVYTEVYSDTNIYVRSLPGGESKRAISSTRDDHSPQFSPNGQMLAFVSKRTGSDEIWIADRDGTNEMRLTRYDGPATGTPRWSPDGRWIAFDSRASGHQSIYVIKVDGGEPTELTPAGVDERLPAWSRDGNSIYFSRQTGALAQIFKRSVRGGEAIQLTQNGGDESFESSDGKLLYFARKGAIRAVPVNGGAEIPIEALKSASYFRYWGVTPLGLFFLPKTEGSSLTLQMMNLRTRQMHDLTSIDNRLLSHAAGASLSPDGRWLAYVQLETMSNDLMVIDHFR